MKIAWIRGRETIQYDRPHTFFVKGIRGSSKSTLLEEIGMAYLNENHTVLDLFGSRDGEALAWLRSPYAKEKTVLLLHGENTVIEKAPCETKPATQLKLGDLENYDLIISASPLYSSPDQEYLHAGEITNLVYQRITWKRYVYTLVREASNLFYSRLKVSDDQITAKSSFIYLIREARHMGLALGLDSIRYFSVDIELRDITDFLVFMSQGMHGFPRDLTWLYRYFDPIQVRRMKPGSFVILSKEGSIGFGLFPYHTWHKEEREHIMNDVGVKIYYEEAAHKGQDKGTFQTVSDFEHAEMIKLYIGGLSMNKIADSKGRSARTPAMHIKQHNNSVSAIGFCPRCRRAKGSYSEGKAVRH